MEESAMEESAMEESTMEAKEKKVEGFGMVSGSTLRNVLICILFIIIMVVVFYYIIWNINDNADINI